MVTLLSGVPLGNGRALSPQWARPVCSCVPGVRQSRENPGPLSQLTGEHGLPFPGPDFHSLTCSRGSPRGCLGVGVVPSVCPRLSGQVVRPRCSVSIFCVLAAGVPQGPDRCLKGAASLHSPSTLTLAFVPSLHLGVAHSALWSL